MSALFRGRNLSLISLSLASSVSVPYAGVAFFFFFGDELLTVIFLLAASPL